MSRTSSDVEKKENAEKKRRSRAKKPPSYHEREREASRQRMAIYRAKVKAEKRARNLKSLLCEEDRAAVEARGAGRRKHLLQVWYEETDTGIDPAALGDEKALRSHITKIDLHKIELQVAEFEMSIMEDGGGEGGYGDLVVGDAAVGSQEGRGEPVKESAKAPPGQEVDQWEPLNVNFVKKVTEEGPKIGLADPHSQACGSTEQAVHKYQLTQDQPVLSNHEGERLAKKEEEAFEDIPESKVGPAHPQVFVDGILEQFRAYPPAPSRYELDPLVEGDAKPSGADAREIPSHRARVGGEEAIDAGQGGGGVDELLAARRDDALPPMDAGCLDADGGGAESFRPDSFAW